MNELMTHVSRMAGSKKVHEPIACLHRLLAHRELLRSLKDTNDLASWRALTKITASTIKVEAFLLSEDLGVGSSSVHVLAARQLSEKLRDARRGYVDEELFLSLYSEYLASVSKVNDRLTLADAMVAATTVAFRGIEEFNSPRAVLQWVVETITVEIASFSEIDVDIAYEDGVLFVKTTKKAMLYNAVGAACCRKLDRSGLSWSPHQSADGHGRAVDLPSDVGNIDDVTMRKSEQHRLEARFQLLLAKRDLLVGKEDVLNYRLNPGSNLKNTLGMVFFRSESAKAKYQRLGQLLTGMADQVTPSRL